MTEGRREGQGEGGLGDLGVSVKGRRREGRGGGGGGGGGERRLFLCVCSRSFIVRSCHTIRPERKEGGWFEHVGSFAHWQREVERACIVHGGMDEGGGGLKGRA